MKTITIWNYSVFGVILGMLFLESCGESKKKNIEKHEENFLGDLKVVVTQAQMNSLHMKIGGLEHLVMKNSISATGTIHLPPKNIASINSFFGGRVKELSLIHGEKVQKNQILFYLENPDYLEIQRAYLESESNLALLSQEYNRQKEPIKDSITSQKSSLQSETNYKNAIYLNESLSKKIQLMGINPSELKETKLTSVIAIRSPFNGYISEVNITNGMFLSPQQNAILIINVEDLHLGLDIYEHDLPHVKEGQLVEFQIQKGSPKYRGKIYLIDKTIDLTKRTIGIHCHIEDEDLLNKSLLPEMYINAKILTEQNHVEALPKGALVNLGEKYYVLKYIKNDGKNFFFERTEVHPGKNSECCVEIRNASIFSKNDKFLVEGAFESTHE